MAHYDWYCDDVLTGKLDIEKVFEDEFVLAFNHPRPVAAFHVVVIPKHHIPSLRDPAALDGALLTSMMRAVQVAAALRELEDGFYLRANAGGAGTTPHMHWHVIGPGAGSHWPQSHP